MASAAFKCVPQPAATTFAIPSVWFLFYGAYPGLPWAPHDRLSWGGRSTSPPASWGSRDGWPGTGWTLTPGEASLPRSGCAEATGGCLPRDIHNIVIHKVKDFFFSPPWYFVFNIICCTYTELQCDLPPLRSHCGEVPGQNSNSGRVVID